MITIISTIIGFLLFSLIVLETANHISRGPLLTEKDNEDIDGILLRSVDIDISKNMIATEKGWFSYHPGMCPWAPINVTLGVSSTVGRIPVWHSKYKKLKRIFQTKQFN